MMKQKKTIVSVGLILFSIGKVHAQEGVNSSGGEASGSGGTVSYSVGQTTYTTNSGTNGNAAQGVQQPYEISTIVGIKETTIKMELSVYPNPTSDYLILKVDASASLSNQQLSYQLYNLKGKEIEGESISSATTTISLEAQQSATYLLHIVKDSQIIKTFRVTKK